MRERGAARRGAAALKGKKCLPRYTLLSFDASSSCVFTPIYIEQREIVAPQLTMRADIN
jgi:hypothetical protein